MCLRMWRRVLMTPFWVADTQSYGGKILRQCSSCPEHGSV